MPNILPTRKADPLAGRVELEVSPACELIVVFEALSRRSHIKGSGLADWIPQTRKKLTSQTLQTVDELFFILPYSLVRRTPTPRTTESFLEMLENMPDETFGDELVDEHQPSQLVREVWEKTKKGELVDKALYKTMIEEISEQTEIDHFLNIAPLLRKQPLVKQLILAALREINEVFFKHEIENILPILQDSVTQARNLLDSRVVPVRQVIEGLTQGITLAENVNYNKIVLVPSYFNAPYVSTLILKDNGLFIVYPARTDNNIEESEKVTQAQLLRRLKALSDKTRLEILQLLGNRSYTNQELVEALGLTQPTISHHMRDLRVAALVRVEQQENTKLYSLRTEFIEQLSKELSGYLKISK